VRLTERQQERYARHLLLDGLGGEGQERLLGTRLRVRGRGRAARWAARYLAVSGVGALAIDDAAAAEECAALSPDVRLSREADIEVAAEDEGGPAACALRGAWAALAAVRDIAGAP
jgi:molybdopterin/thiamine biosynthesis adenylyltransferase